MATHDARPRRRRRIPHAVARTGVGTAIAAGALLGALLPAALAQAGTAVQDGTAGGSLPSTGAESWIVALIAAVLLMTGLALVLLRRLRRPAVSRSLLRSSSKNRRRARATARPPSRRG